MSHQRASKIVDMRCFPEPIGQGQSRLWARREVMAWAVSSSACDGARIRALDIDDLLEIARQEARRSLTNEECSQYLHVDHCSRD